MPEPSADILKLADIRSRRGRLEILHGVSLEMGNEVVAVFGLNASGKSTLLRTISGLTPAVGGSILLAGSELTGLGAHRVARLGIGFMPQDNQVFRSRDVEENLRIAARLIPRRNHQIELDRVLDYFPQLQKRRQTHARLLSGGERQMLALAMVLIRSPRILLMDEPSAGLAPAAISAIYDVLGRLRENHLPILMAEQNLQRALEIADRAVVLALGRCAGVIDVRRSPDPLVEVKELMIKGNASEARVVGSGTGTFDRPVGLTDRLPGL